VGGRDADGTVEVTVEGGDEKLRVSPDLAGRLFVGAP
jgi:hypothetical protein